MPIWAKFMEGTYKQLNIPVEYFELASGVITAQFCQETMDQGDAKLATQYCPNVVTDIVNSKNLPRECDIHTGGKIKQEDKKGNSGW